MLNHVKSSYVVKLKWTVPTVRSVINWMLYGWNERMHDELNYVFVYFWVSMSYVLCGPIFLWQDFTVMQFTSQKLQTMYGSIGHEMFLFIEKHYQGKFLSRKILITLQNFDITLIISCHSSLPKLSLIKYRPLVVWRIVFLFVSGSS